MPKTGGDITRKRILDVAEDLFSEKGFDGTGMEEIARKTGINKATIYYHFKNKYDILEALFNSIIIDLNNHLKAPESHGDSDQQVNLSEKIGKEIQFIEAKKKIISIMIMESLKDGDGSDFLFKCAEIIMNNELKMHSEGFNSKKDLFEKDKMEFIVYEFFTGFIPFIMFIVFKEKFSEFFNYDKESVFKKFLESFKKSHLDGHI
ncbi:MAG: TetR/AcrR family transcriptional regulator [bacterium]|nr:TetR/AcrR family transcriptional regulator [bacterium]